MHFTAAAAAAALINAARQNCTTIRACFYRAHRRCFIKLCSLSSVGRVLPPARPEAVPPGERRATGACRTHLTHERDPLVARAATRAGGRGRVRPPRGHIFTQRLCAVAAGWTSPSDGPTRSPAHGSRYGSAHAHGPGGEPPRRFDLCCSALSRFHAARHSSTDSRLPPTAVLILNSKFRQSFVFRSMLRPAASVASRLPLLTIVS
jgi:hypothetical protein